MKRVILSIAAIGLLTLSVGLSKASRAQTAARQESKSSQIYQVRIDNFSFGPATLTVPVGATVTWVNQDDVPHNVISTAGKTLNSPLLDTDQKFSFTFTKAGTYPYYCSIHPRMIAKVIVR